MAAVAPSSQLPRSARQLILSRIMHHSRRGPQHSVAIGKPTQQDECCCSFPGHVVIGYVGHGCQSYAETKSTVMRSDQLSFDRLYYKSSLAA
jgi:hypothetical protein